MNQPTRLEAARQAEDGGSSDWYRSPLVLLAALILFAGVLALIVVSVSGDDDEPVAADPAVVAAQAAVEDSVAPPPAFGGDEVAEVGVVTVVGAVLPAATDGDDPALGLKAPVVRTTSLGNGAAISLEPGRARVIGFFAHWCPHCQAELPEVAAWLVENELPANTEFIVVSTAVNPERDNYPPSVWFEREGWPSPVVVDDAEGTLLGAYGFTGFPAFIAIDASGFVVQRAGGNIGADGVADLFSNFAAAPQT